MNTQAVAAKPTSTQFKVGTSTPDFKCYKSGEPGHRTVECKKGDCLGKNLFLKTEEEAEEHNSEPDPILEYDETVNPELEEFVTGDCGPLLVVHRACFAPKEKGGDAWLRNNIF